MVFKNGFCFGGRQNKFFFFEVKNTNFRDFPWFNTHTERLVNIILADMCFSDCFSMFKEELGHNIVIYAGFLAKIDQNISAKIPNAMQLSVMYGSNMDQLKDFANPGSQFSQKEGVVMGGLFNTSADKHKEGLDIAFRNPITR